MGKIPYNKICKKIRVSDCTSAILTHLLEKHPNFKAIVQMRINLLQVLMYRQTYYTCLKCSISYHYCFQIYHQVLFVIIFNLNILKPIEGSKDRRWSIGLFQTEMQIENGIVLMTGNLAKRLMQSPFFHLS